LPFPGVGKPDGGCHVAGEQFLHDSGCQRGPERVARILDGPVPVYALRPEPARQRHCLATSSRRSSCENTAAAAYSRKEILSKAAPSSHRAICGLPASVAGKSRSSAFISQTSSHREAACQDRRSVDVFNRSLPSCTAPSPGDDAGMPRAAHHYSCQDAPGLSQRALVRRIKRPASRPLSR
jgi:hypothetical protein